MLQRWKEKECVCISVWNDKALSRFALQNNQTHRSRERGERKAALRERNFPCTTVLAVLYGQTAEILGWGRDSAQSPGHPSWTFPKRSLRSLTYSTSSTRVRVSASPERELESDLVWPVNSSQSCPLGWPVAPAFLTFDPSFQKK